MKRPGQSGQTMVFMVLILIAACMILLWHFDFHKILYVKTLAQNAGDAAALNAARWQGQTLNMIGDLNIIKALAITQAGPDMEETVEQIDNLQARLAYVGPLLGLLGAQQAAKNNNIFNHAPFTRRLTSHAENVASDYSLIFTEPYENCWQEYSDMLLSIAEQGVAAGPDNASLYTDYAGGHTLLRPDFYEAVAGREWCWFWRYDLALLENYIDYLYWPGLPPMEALETSPLNSEIFGLGLTVRTTSFGGGRFESVAYDRPWGEGVVTNASGITGAWYCYSPSVWSTWRSISREGPDPFPALGDIRPQYDYAGADAAVRVVAEADRVSPDKGASVITWTAAAKAFGYLDNLESPDQPIRPNNFAIVLPAFREVRLVPLDASSAPAGGAYDLEWREHIEIHLPLYMDHGPGALEHDCWYCRQLIRWEDYDFRQQGINWLFATDDRGERINNCHRYTGPGGPGGGARRGH